MLRIAARSRRTAVVAVGALVVGGVAGVAPAGAAVRYCQGQQVTIVASASDTTITGTEGPDVIDGIGRLRLTINGLGGDDVICTGPGYQVVVHGGEGDDSLESEIVGGSGEQTRLLGEAGDDVLRIAADPMDKDGSDGNPVILDGGEGDDQFAVGAGGHRGELVPGPGDDDVVSAGDATISYARAAEVHIDVPGGVVDGEGHDTFTGVNRFIGSPGSDTFIGSDGDDTFFQAYDQGADLGTDVLTGGGGDDLLSAERGTIDGGAGDDVLRVGDGTVTGGPGADWIEIGDSGTARGGSGSDNLRVTRRKAGSEGALQVFGDAGNDVVNLRFLRSDWTTTCRAAGSCRTAIDAGTGRDLLTFELWAAIQVDLRSGRATYQSARIGVQGIEDVVGTRYADTLLGDSRPNRLSGRDGNDVLRGRAGADVLAGGSGRDRVDGGPGADRCSGEVRRSC